MEFNAVIPYVRVCFNLTDEMPIALVVIQFVFVRFHGGLSRFHIIFKGEASTSGMLA